tara:strand:+ start:346 stop:1101 length:756 start_codon:yes stop_codon:yes gene_type:complete
MPSHYGNGRNGGMNGNGRSTTTRSTTNDNPVTRLFNAPSSPRYYRPDGSIVPIGAPLHEHQDGTIMTEHSMGPNDNSVIVTINQNVTPPRVNRTNGRTNNSIRYVFADTGVEYTGRIVEIGGIMYSTDTGTKQGNSREIRMETNFMSSPTARSTRVPRRGRAVRRNGNGITPQFDPNIDRIRYSGFKRTIDPFSENPGTRGAGAGMNGMGTQAPTSRRSTQRRTTTRRNNRTMTRNTRTMRTTRRSGGGGY